MHGEGGSPAKADDVDVLVEQQEELLSAFDLPAYESASEIAGITANLIDNGATIQLGLAELSPSIAKALAQKTDLGVHTEILTDDLMELVSRGVVTNRHKTLNEGKVIASGAIGTGSWCFSVPEKQSMDVTEIIGSKGRISFSFFSNSVLHIETDTMVENFDLPNPPHVHQPLVELVVQELRGEGKCPSTGETGLRATQLMDIITNK